MNTRSQIWPIRGHVEASTKFTVQMSWGKYFCKHQLFHTRTNRIKFDINTTWALEPWLRSLE